MENNRITADSLAEKLVNSRKIMNKVDNGDFVKGNIDKTKIISENNEMTETPTNHIQTRQMTDQAPTREKIMSSKLPDSIKKAMMENPIPKISLNDSLDMRLTEKAKKLMEKEGMVSQSSKGNTNMVISDGDLERRMTPIIENVVRKTIGEILDKKIEQLLSLQQSMAINETLVLKVGDSIFKGKITDVRSVK